MRFWTRIEDGLTDSERRTLFQWGEDIYGGSGHGLHWRPTETHVVGYWDDAPVSHVGMVRCRLAVGGQERWVIGIGEVVTVPGFRSRGFGGECLLRARERMADLGAGHGFLFCPERLTEYYQKFGWRRIQTEVRVGQPSGRAVMPLCSMVLELSGAWPEGPVEIPGLPF